MDELKVWKVADKMVSVYGADADLHAEMRAEAARYKKHYACQRLWERVILAILILDRRKPNDRASLN